MKPTTEILENISKNSRKNKTEIFTRLYRYLLRPDLCFMAYQNLYANKGAATKGVDDDTADGFSQEKIDRIITSLADGSYTPKPVRRKYVNKKRGSKKQRPLGIPTFTDKLVQEAVRMVLESVYEPIFSKHSHGFRPNRSCHTALQFLKKDFTGITWRSSRTIRSSRYSAVLHRTARVRMCSPKHSANRRFCPARCRTAGRKAGRCR